MNKISITVDAALVTKWLADSPAKIKTAISRIIMQATFLIERYAKINAPVDTGRLRSSIYTDIRPMSSTVSTNTNYARYVHDGTRYMNARPFMKNAARQAKGEMKGIFDSEIDSALE